MFSDSKTLVVVYRDELLVNKLKKLVETRVDVDEDQATRLMEDSINIVAWTEKVWLEQKKAGNITSKVLYIGDIKGTDKLIPVVDIKFNDYGAKFGWAGNQAIVFADSSKIKDETAYSNFLRELSKLPVPDILKKDKKAHLEVKKVEFLDKVAKKIQGVFDKRAEINQQLLTYAIFNFYYDGLKSFIEA